MSDVDPTAAFDTSFAFRFSALTIPRAVASHAGRWLRHKTRRHRAVCLQRGHLPAVSVVTPRERYDICPRCRADLTPPPEAR